MGSGIGNTLAEFPSVLDPLCLEPRLLLAGKELGDHFWLLIVDAAAIGALAATVTEPSPAKPPPES